MSNEVGWSTGPSNAKLAALRWAVGTRALDVGSGRGWYASALADRGFAVTGMDREDRAEDPRINKIVGPIQRPFPAPDSAFDTVLLFDILEHLDDEPGILAEVSRVCAPGGRVLLSVPHANDGVLPSYGLTYLHRIDRTHVREYTPEALSRHLESFGFHTLYCALEGRAHIPLVFSEFVHGPAWMKAAARCAIIALQKARFVHNPSIAGDIHWIGEKSA